MIDISLNFGWEKHEIKNNKWNKSSADEIYDKKHAK